MRTLLASLILSAAASAALAQPAPSGGLTLTFSGLEPRGHVMGAVFASEAAYNGQGAPARAFRIAAGSAEVSEQIAGLAPGRYAIKAFHDLDDDGAMDANPFGLPTEPYAISNNARGAMGPARWADAAFEVDADGTVHTITLR